MGHLKLRSGLTALALMAGGLGPARGGRGAAPSGHTARLKLRSGLTALALMGGVLGPAGAAMSAPASAQAASVTTLYVVPGAAAGGTGTSQLPFATIDQAEQAAHQDSASSDVVVGLAGGTYRLTQPLTFTSADSGQSGHTISYAAPAAQTAA